MKPYYVHVYTVAAFILLALITQWAPRKRPNLWKLSIQCAAVNALLAIAAAIMFKGL